MDTPQSDGRSDNELPLAKPSDDKGSWSWPKRAAFLFGGVFLPVICLVIGYPDGPVWQSGELQAFAELLLTRRTSVALSPFLLYNMVCITLTVADPERYARYFAVRLGIYTGMLLALQYSVIFGIALAGSGFIVVLAIQSLISGIAVLVGWGIVAAIAAWQRSTFSEGMQAVLIVAVLIGSAVAVYPGGPILILLCFFCSTIWATASYTVMAFRIVRHQRNSRFRFSLAQLLGVVTWTAAYLGAWRTAVNWMLLEYAKLPVDPPDDCYVCTAAAKGHRRLVGSETLVAAGGKVYCVNDQMRYLKAAELALAAVSPRFHGVVRRIYDHLGPAVATMLVHPLLADIAYVSLNPCQWAARAGLAVLLPDGEALIRGLYSADGEHLPDADPQLRRC